MKRLVELDGYIEAMFRDIAPLYSKQSEMKRDLTRLLHETEVHGLRILTIDLPSISKHLDRCLGDSLYTPSGLHLCSPRRGYQVPRFFEDLYLQIFHHDGKLRQSPCINAITALRQALKGLAKPSLECGDKEKHLETLSYQDNEQDLRHPTSDWNNGFFSATNLFTNSLASFEDGRHQIDDYRGLQRGFETFVYHGCPDANYLKLLQRVCDSVASSLGDVFTTISSDDCPLPKHGTGSVSDLTVKENKFSFPSWPDKLESVFPFAHYGCLNLDHYFELEGSQSLPSRECGMSKLIAVPKSMSGPRLIASEPTSHMWMQQQVRLALETMIAKNKILCQSIDFKDQSHNQRLALSSSKDGCYATIDLKSASDRLTLWTLERVFRKNVPILQALCATRTQMIENKVSKNSWKTMFLKKAFSQGNACTFTVQTLVFSIFGIAADIIHNGKYPSDNNLREAAKSVRVFGDDIIIPSEHFETMCKILQFNQLKVNPQKTFPRGKFRESCGTDAFDGVNVTPSYVKVLHYGPTHERVLACLDASNNLHRNGWWNIAQWQFSLIKRYKNLLPFNHPHEDNRVGIISFSGSSEEHLKRRYNEDYHRWDIRTVSLNHKTKRVRSNSLHDVLQYITEAPNPTQKWEAGRSVGLSLVLRQCWSESKMHFAT